MRGPFAAVHEPAVGTKRQWPRRRAAHAFIRFQQQAYGKRGLHIEIVGQDHIPEEITPFPYKFFYWIDPWAVQWEMEQGRPVDRAVAGIVG